MIIYLITNKVNGKKYVGKTSRDLDCRWREHQLAAKKEEPDFYIARSIKHHGAENFTVKVIEECDSEKALAEAEIAWIAKLSTHGPAGYNLTDGGEGLSGWVATEEARRNMSEASKNRAPPTEEHRRNISIANSGENNAFFGKSWGRKGPHTEDTKKNMSLAHTGKVLTEEHKNNISKGCKGKPGPNKGRKFDDSSRAKMSLSRSFPIDVYQNGECIFTCFTSDDACVLFKPEGLSGRKMRKLIAGNGSIGSFSFFKCEENIASLKLKNNQKG
mgnify:CR=1 FL=1